MESEDRKEVISLQKKGICFISFQSGMLACDLNNAV